MTDPFNSAGRAVPVDPAREAAILAARLRPVRPGPRRFRKKPVEIEAMRFDGSNAETHAVYQWIEANTLGSFEPMGVIEGRKPYPASGVSIDPRDGRMIISTLEGLHWVNLGDYVIRGVQGEFYPCKPDVFAATYDAV